MDGKSQPYLLSFTYPRQAITWLCPLRRPTAWKRVTFPPDGVIGIEAREGWRDSGLCYRPRHKWADMCCAERAVIGFGLTPGPIPWKYGRASYPERQQGWVPLMGKVTQLCRVNNKKLWLSHPCSRKELQNTARKASQVMTKDPWRL